MPATRTIDERLARRFLAARPREAAQLLERLSSDEAAAALESNQEAAAAVLEHMDRNAAAACVRHYPSDRRPALLAALRPDRAARLLRLLAPAEQATMLDRCSAPVARPIRRLLRFTDGTAGALMDPNPLSAPRDISIAEARRSLERGADDVLYVIERNEVLAGMLPLRLLLQAPDDALLESQMIAAVPRIGARAELDAILAHRGWQEHHQLPVVDRHDELLGVIRYQTMRSLEADTARSEPTISLGLALGEMYWSMMSTLVGTVAHALPARPPAPGKPR